MKKLLFIAAAIFAVAFTSRADTSYLLIQGDFGLGPDQTYLWKVLYQPGSLTTSQDLLNTVFGQPVDTGTTYTEQFGTYEVWAAGNSQNKVQYLQFSFGKLVYSFTLNGVTETMDFSTSPGWNSYVAGGSGEAATPDFLPGNYPTGIWSSSNEGLATRGLSDGSFDGWVYGATFPSVAIANGDTTNAPKAENFTTATVINVVPEPGSAALLLVGTIGLVWRRRG